MLMSDARNFSERQKKMSNKTRHIVINRNREEQAG